MLKTTAMLLAGVLACCGCAQQATEATSKAESGGKAEPIHLEKLEAPGLSNVLRATGKIISGSEPHGDEGFASLEKLGVKTIVSVDGARPDVEAAHAHGLKYVHIPIGYDGVPASAGAALTRLAREINGPIYIHCHHGQHRGPAAAAIACIASGQLDKPAAIEILRTAGTDKNYQGLWRDVESFVPPASDAELPELVEVAEVGSLAAAMAQLDRHFDNLKLCRAAKWQTPADHADLVPAQEALIVKEGLREAARQLGPEHDARFREWLAEAEQLADKLETALRATPPVDVEPEYARLEQSCKQCHKAYRNVAR